MCLNFNYFAIILFVFTIAIMVIVSLMTDPPKENQTTGKQFVLTTVFFIQLLLLPPCVLLSKLLTLFCIQGTHTFRRSIRELSQNRLVYPSVHLFHTIRSRVHQHHQLVKSKPLGL